MAVEMFRGPDHMAMRSMGPMYRPPGGARYVDSQPFPGARGGGKIPDLLFHPLGRDLARRYHRHSSAPGAASWWLLLALVLVTTFGFYVWYQQNKEPELPGRAVQVAVADSSGPIPALDTARVSNGPGSTTSIDPQPVDPGPFIAPPPDFERSSAVPVANLLDYARRMRFDPSRGAELALPVDEYGRMREVSLEPLASLRRLDSIAFAQGRIIARIKSGAALPALSIHNGDSFIWVQGTLGAPIQAEVWSTSVVVPPKILRLSYTARPPGNAPEGKDAFWLGEGNDRILWIACGRGWCHS